MSEPNSGPRRQPGLDVWLWAPGGAPAPGLAREAGSVRIGDTERDEAVASLGDHFAAGRLDRDELDERIDRAMQARFHRDLEPLFVDLPATAPAGRRAPAEGGGTTVSPAPPLLFWLIPVLMVGVVIGAVALGAPWLLWTLVWMMMFGRFWGRRHHPTHVGPHPRP